MRLTEEQQVWLTRPTLLPPALRQVEGTRLWEFAEPYSVSLPPPHWPTRLEIPAGWRFDRASIPSIVPTWLISKDHLGCLGPAAHDAGYRCRGSFLALPPGLEPTVPYLTDGGGTPVEVSVRRADVDRWLLLYLLRQRVIPWRAWSAYYAVSWYWGAVEAIGYRLW